MTPDQLRERLAQFAAALSRFCAPLFDNPRSRSTADQLTRSAAAAMSNYRAAGRARSHVEFTAKIGLALEEIDESQGWLRHLSLSGLLNSADRAVFDTLVQECSELTAILTAATATARRRDAANRARARPPKG